VILIVKLRKGVRARASDKSCPPIQGGMAGRAGVAVVRERGQAVDWLRRMLLTGTIGMRIYGLSPFRSVPSAAAGACGSLRSCLRLPPPLKPEPAGTPHEPFSPSSQGHVHPAGPGPVCGAQGPCARATPWPGSPDRTDGPRARRCLRRSVLDPVEAHPAAPSGLSPALGTSQRPLLSPIIRG
jgi:hypothetical protein